MITVDEASETFRQRLELSPTEQQDAIRKPWNMHVERRSSGSKVRSPPPNPITGSPNGRRARIRMDLGPA